jgi:hypothetical protein
MFTMRILLMHQVTSSQGSEETKKAEIDILDDTQNVY